ncbi:MAG: universal stress protein [Alphaproteobacteria bacterium]|nr:universal stress protein [Alphaproteobacteria bacterium]MBU6471707.1 universal stress protein [Alphaproteobacteria bacterium]MDE2013117.1 universal stress protein [Alphaproteobacteria bacterium]MDE2073048.1 universal stress protein [Alphaproteobacteria bacterium]MDE2351937.1 universal stress protein [Alphaproteobacteria bacterium]
MSYAKILAPLTGGARDAIVLASAFAAAKPFHAHVVALFVRPDPSEAMPFFGEGVSGVVVQEIIDAAKAAADKAAEVARATLAKAATEAGVELVGHPALRDVATVSYREMQGNFADRVTQASRLSDLVLFGPLAAGDKPGLSEAFEATLLETGRPVLLTAQVPPKNFARRVALGWDGSLTCARAVSAAMPLLEKAEAVEVLCVCNGDMEGLDDLKEFLSLHGISCSARKIEAGARPVGEVLLETALQGGAGLLVLGGYGHTRLRQLFFGGVTRHVVSHAELPLLLVH